MQQFFRKNQTRTTFQSQLLEDFFPKRLLVRSLPSSFTDSLSFAKKRCITSQGFGAFSFSHVIDACSLFITLSLSFFLFLDFEVISDFVFNKTIILPVLAGYQMIITNSALGALLIIYHLISSQPRRIIANYHEHRNYLYRLLLLPNNRLAVFTSFPFETTTAFSGEVFCSFPSPVILKLIVKEENTFTANFLTKVFRTL